MQVPPEALAQPRSYGQFVEYVVQEFSGGRRFVDDLPGEAIAERDDPEAIAERQGFPRR